MDQIINDQRERKSLIQFVADRPGHDLRYAIDPSKAEQELGWLPMEPVQLCSRANNSVVYRQSRMVGTDPAGRVLWRTLGKKPPNYAVTRFSR